MHARAHTHARSYAPEHLLMAAITTGISNEVRQGDVLVREHARVCSCTSDAHVCARAVCSACV